MVDYKCILCNFVTKNKRNYIQHNSTKKHLLKSSSGDYGKEVPTISHSNTTVIPHQNNTKKSYTCKYCDTNFSRIDSLTRHKKTCTDKNEELMVLKQKLEQYEKEAQLKSEQYDKDTRRYKKDVNYHMKETEYYKQLLREAGGLVKKSVNALTFAVDNYDAAPPIKTITVQEIDTFDDDNTEDNNKKQIVEDILSAYKHKTLGKYLGDFIIKIYKKDDPKNQSIWNTDDSRLTYLIKELMNNESSNWIIDKKGIKTKTYLIEPLLIYIKGLLISYQSNYNVPELNLNSVEIDFILDNSKKIMELTNDIDDGIIGKDVLKHISGHLRFSNKLME